MTPIEMIEEARTADKKAVEDFNARYGWGGYPPIEERLAFAEWRLKLWIGNLSCAIEALAKHPATPGDQHGDV